MLPLRVRVDLGAIAMKGYSAFPNAPALLEPHHQIIYYHIQNTRWRWWDLTPSEVMQSVCSIAPADGSGGGSMFDVTKSFHFLEHLNHMGHIPPPNQKKASLLVILIIETVW